MSAHPPGPSPARTVRPQPLLVVADVQASSRWYQQILGASSGHGGHEYEQLIVDDDDLVLQLHSPEGDAAHGPLADPAVRVGNGVVVWFELADLDAALDRIAASGAEVERPVRVNPLAHHREVWLRDPDGYLVVLAGQ